MNGKIIGLDFLSTGEKKNVRVGPDATIESMLKALGLDDSTHVENPRTGGMFSKKDKVYDQVKEGQRLKASPKLIAG